MMEITEDSLKIIAERAIEIQDLLDHVKPLYSELDELTMLLTTAKDIDRKYGISIKDNFAEKNVVWKSTATRRFQLVVSKRRKGGFSTPPYSN